MDTGATGGVVIVFCKLRAQWAKSIKLLLLFTNLW